MGEFKLHLLTQELLDKLGNKSSPAEYVEYLQKHIASNSTTVENVNFPSPSHLQQLAERSNNPQAFMSKFEDLKEKNVDSLGQYIDLMQKIGQDSNMREFLAQTASKLNKQATNSAPITKDTLPQVRSRLKSAASNKSRDKEPTKRASAIKSSLSMSITPSVTSWIQRRPCMSWDFSVSSASLTHTINNIPVCSQENIIIEDLLNIFMGLPANFIEVQELKDPYDPREFVLNDFIDPSVKELVKRMLPLASHYSIIQRFTEEKMRFEFGQVNNALAEDMSSIIIDYMTFIAQLETEFRNGNLTLQKVWYYIQKSLHSLQIVSNIATTINKSGSCGGKVLSLLHDKIAGNIGDYKAQDLCIRLMQAACVPYMKMLGMWIYKGIIADPIHEFLVEDNEVVQKEDMPVDYSADYWDKKYTIRRERIPKFLEPVSEIILRAGKYLNVIRQCGKSLNNKVQNIEYKKEEKFYIESIETAYKFASQTLLNLVLGEQDLLGRLKSVKHYFLLDQGDFIVTFLTLCEKELSKDVADVIQTRLDSLLDLALRISSATNDPYKDDLRTELLPYDLQFQMFKILMEQQKQPKAKSLTVIESFSFSYEVRWPLSLILDRKSLARYQMIFRHLLHCKYVERMICQVWRANKVANKFQAGAAKQYRNTFALRQRMLHCVQNLEYHMMVEVIEPHWCMFLQKLSKVTNVDEVLSIHSDFLDSCLKDCMLTIPSLLAVVTKLLLICVSFCKFMQAESINPEGHEDILSFEQNITRFDTEFTGAIMNLLEQINSLNRSDSDHDRLFNLLYRMSSIFSSEMLKDFKKLLEILSDLSTGDWTSMASTRSNLREWDSSDRTITARMPLDNNQYLP
ncbi:gamma-tubulin complex component 2-like isoform X2 [Atheta coriaria]|uniref:gamma-tubulin complex component 2-like isoform X2 n=1 Tax=Dalotia coriaria TaxID=877792 RepID=UPI0031F381A1